MNMLSALFSSIATKIGGLFKGKGKSGKQRTVTGEKIGYVAPVKGKSYYVPARCWRKKHKKDFKKNRKRGRYNRGAKHLKVV